MMHVATLGSATGILRAECWTACAWLAVTKPDGKPEQGASFPCAGLSGRTEGVGSYDDPDYTQEDDAFYGDFEVTQGDDWGDDLEIRLGTYTVDPEDVTWEDLSECEFFAQVRAKKNLDSDVLATMAVTGDADGYVTLALTADATSDLPITTTDSKRLYFDVHVVYPNGRNRTRVKGRLRVTGQTSTPADP